MRDRRPGTTPPVITAHQTRIERQATRYDFLPSLLDDGDKRSEIIRETERGGPWARNQVGKGVVVPARARLHRLVESIPVLLKSFKYRLGNIPEFPLPPLPVPRSAFFFIPFFILLVLQCL